MRTSTAYFAGIGTVVAGIAIGLGGGLTIANIVSPHPDKSVEMTRLERRMSGEPIPAANLPAAPVSYLAAPQPEAAAPAPVQAEPRTEAASPVPIQSPVAEQPAATSASTAKSQDASIQSPPAAAPSAAVEQAAKPQDALAKARDADVKRVERNRSERRQQWADRRQQWADRRRHEPRQNEQLHAQEPLDVEQKVGEDTEPHEFPTGPRIEFPQIKLFGPD